MVDWLVVSTPSKNMSQNGHLAPKFGMKIENISNHQPILTFVNQEPGVVSAIFVGVLGGFGVISASS